MQIKFVEIQNFRKLKAIRIDFNETTTLFVGANNSGKTSAMTALGHFLVNSDEFSTNDFTLSNWSLINELGKRWEVPPIEGKPTVSITDLEPALPSLDVWLDVNKDEVHYVRHLLPSLNWSGGLLGVRLRFEPRKVEELQKHFFFAFSAASETNKAASKAAGKDGAYSVSLWPKNLRHFLDRKLHSTFSIRAYLLDPKKCEGPVGGIAKPQKLAAGLEPIEGNPFRGIIRINEIAAQRGFGNSRDKQRDDEHDEGAVGGGKARKLSEQLRSYYRRHLDPSEFPAPADLEALQAIENAQEAFDERLEISFSDALKELASLNYPGVTDPRMKIATRLRPTDGLNHGAAVQYEILSGDGKSTPVPMTLPEEYNGLGYQNLISMVFRLMSFRDAWMRVGKLDRADGETEEAGAVPPLHLVLIEEPEAHLHAQVQQVFINKAYKILRKHRDLSESKTLRTQLVVSTHSSHLAHECEFSSLRYFRRLPASEDGLVPTTSIVNLSQVFGPDDETARFVTRYIKTSHCDLFFCDAAIVVEGPAERMLVPHFIRRDFPELSRCYISLLEMGGSHAHRMKDLIESLGLITLLVTDIDSAEGSGKHPAVAPRRGCGQISRSEVLKTWHPSKEKLEELLDFPEDKKEKSDYSIPLFSIRVAYQAPIKVKLNEKSEAIEALASTFEDALVFENIELFRQLDGTGLVKKFRTALEEKTSLADLGAALHEALRDGKKAEFALDMLWLEKPKAGANSLLKELKAPSYIRDGLGWLQKQLVRSQEKILGSSSFEQVNGAAQ